MKTLFTIGSEEQIKSQDTLLMEIGMEYCSYAFLNESDKSFNLIEFISFDDFEASEKIGMIAERLKTINPGRIIASSAFTEALLVPYKYSNESEQLVDTIFDHNGVSHLKDHINEWQICTSYSIPSAIYDALNTTFPEVSFLHVYTPAIKINTSNPDNYITVYFTTLNFRILVKNNNQVVLAQTYTYKTPLDVIYYLLKICYEFNLNQSEVKLIISGLVDSDSALFIELKNYFLNIQFPDPPEYSLPKNDHPHYYFTSLYNLAECAL